MKYVAQVGDTSAIVTLDNNNHLWYFSQTIGTAGWNKNPVSTGNPVSTESKFTSAPSIAQVGDQAVIAVAGYDGTLWVYQQNISTLPTGNWNLTFDLGDQGSLSQDPSVAQVGDSAVIALVDNSGTLWSYQRKIGAKDWSQQPVAGPGPGKPEFALQSPSVAQVGDSAVIAAVDTSGGLWFYWQTIDTTLWSPGQLVDGPTTESGNILAYPSVAQVGNSSVIIAVDGGSLWFYWQTIGTTPWNPEPVFLAEPEGHGEAILAYPSVAQVGDSAVIAAANSNPSISLQFYWQAIGTAGWNNPPEYVPVPGTVLGSPSVAQVGNSSVIVASDTNGVLWYFWQTIGTAGWTKEIVASAESLGG